MSSQNQIVWDKLVPLVCVSLITLFFISFWKDYWEGVMYFEMPFYMFSFSFASAIFFILYFSYLTIIKKSKEDIFNYRVVALSILISIVVMLGIYFYVYMPLQGNSIVDNPFEKVEITSIDVKKAGTLDITLNCKNTGGSNANITKFFIDNKTLSSYATFVDVYEASGKSIKNLLDDKVGFVLPVGKEEKFVIVFTKDSFASGQILHIGLTTVVYVNTNEVAYSTSCKIP